MKAITGIELTPEYIPSFTWVKDIQFFEVSLTAEYKTDKNESYVFHWCDCEGDVNRWLAVRTSKRALYALTSGVIEMRDFFENYSLDSNVLILDLEPDDNVNLAKLVHISEIAEDYLPESGEFIDPEFIPRNSSKNEYMVLIDHEWEQYDFHFFTRKFMDAYAMIAQYAKAVKRNPSQNWQHLRRMTDAPWIGGGSSNGFYSDLRSQFGSEIGLNAIHYASPGYLKFKAKREVGVKVKENLDLYLSSRQDIDRHFRKIETFIRINKLNDDDTVFTQQHHDYLMENGKILMDYFNDPSWEWVLSGSPDLFRAVKVSMSFYRRINEISRFVLDERAQLGNF